MRNLLYILLISLSLTSCGGSGSGGGSDTENEAPSIPVALSPTNNSLCLSNELEFTWSASTDDQTTDILYQIDVSASPGFETIFRTGKTMSTSKVFSLDKGVNYFWRVKAIDENQKESDYTEAWQFITESEATSNHVPFTPELIGPSDDSSITSTNVTLQWSCTDADDDVLSYSVYFGASQEPALVQEDLSEASLARENLTSGVTYYWYVVAKDGSGSSSQSKLWSFSVD